MTLLNLRLDHGGIAEILKSGEMASAVHGAAENIAQGVQRVMVEGVPGKIPIPVEVRDYDGGDRVASSVSLDHPAGLAVQAKHGVLTAGAAAAGHEVKTKP